MQVIHTSFKKRKAKKPTAKQRELDASWEKLLKKYETKPVKKTVKAVAPTTKPFVRETPHYPSLNSGYHDCTKKAAPVYTGSAIKGIGTMHKSNAVPIFSDEQAIEIATMRRG
jgi:hypothetical protein